MAKHFIFNSDGTLWKIAASDEAKNSLMPRANEGSVSKSVSDTDWNAVAKFEKYANLSGDTISYNDDVPAIDKETFDSFLSNQINFVQAYITNNPNDSEWSNYLDNLKSIDSESITFPVDNFQKWFNSQSGFSSKSILELP